MGLPGAFNLSHSHHICAVGDGAVCVGPVVLTLLNFQKWWVFGRGGTHLEGRGRTSEFEDILVYEVNSDLPGLHSEPLSQDKQK